jgi:hypothetical protein
MYKKADLKNIMLQKLLRQNVYFELPIYAPKTTWLLLNIQVLSNVHTEAPNLQDASVECHGTRYLIRQGMILHLSCFIHP